MIPISFDSCFSEKKILKFLPLVGVTVQAVARFGPVHVRRPRFLGGPVRCMTKAEIREGKIHGAGHGLYYLRKKEIRINASMTWKGIYLNFIHELAHHFNRDLTEGQINSVVVPSVYFAATGKKLSPGSWRKYRSTNPEGG